MTRWRKTSSRRGANRNGLPRRRPRPARSARPRRRRPSAARRQRTGKRISPVWAILLSVIALLVATIAILDYTQRRAGERPIVTELVNLLHPGRPAATPTAPASRASRRQPTEVAAEHTVPAQERTRVAVIVDDVGRELEGPQRLAATGLPVTLAILPFLPHSAEVADLAQKAGMEVFLHCPMEPTGYPERADPGEGALLAGMNIPQLLQTLRKDLRNVPGAVGLNNHMGSAFTAREETVRTVLEELKRRRLVFVDSRTTADTVAERLAREIGVPTARRDIFLDTYGAEDSVEKVSERVAQLVDKARKNGSAIGICHDKPRSIEALLKVLPGLSRIGVELVHASALCD
jgi:polysaccharide deacetylase 2 family uncharacterized protein YibQ